MIDRRPPTLPPRSALAKQIRVLSATAKALQSTINDAFEAAFRLEDAALVREEMIAERRVAAIHRQTARDCSKVRKRLPKIKARLRKINAELDRLSPVIVPREIDWE